MLLLTDSQQEYPATPCLATTSFKDVIKALAMSFANKIVKALLKHNHHEVYINGKVTECFIWIKLFCSTLI